MMASVSRSETETREPDYRSFFENAVEGMFQSTVEGWIESANPAMARMLGYSSTEELIGSVSHVDQLWMEPEKRLELLAEKSSHGSFECEMRRRDGATTWVSLAVRAVRDPSGAIVTYFGIVTDINEWQQTLKLQQSLQRTERMSVIGALVAGVAHEVRNPLFAITANLDALEAELSAGKPCQESLAAVNEAVSRLSRLMADLLDFGSPASTELRPGSVDEVLQLAARSCEPLARRKDVALRVDAKGGLPVVDMDRHRLGQVFQNLLQNAVQHSPAGCLVEVAARPLRVDGRLWIDCTFDDSGPGIDRADLPHLFEPFFTRRRGGTGLGLSIVQKIVEDHGGTVSAANREEGGARLLVRLPATGCPPEAGSQARTEA